MGARMEKTREALNDAAFGYTDRSDCVAALAEVEEWEAARAELLKDKLALALMAEAAEAERDRLREVMRQARDKIISNPGGGGFAYSILDAALNDEGGQTLES